jgi:hypothetical protein
MDRSGADDFRSAELPLSDDGTALTDAEVRALNDAALLRTAQRVRWAGAAMVIIGLLAAAGWGWTMARSQQVLDDPAGGFGGAPGAEINLAVIDRIDILTSSLPFLAVAAIAVGTGIAVRLYAEGAILRAGGSLTPFSVGDPVLSSDDEES